MKLSAHSWVLRLKEDGWGWMLRLTLLFLPWQTRYFSEGPNMGGGIWEQGRWSLYATMILMAFVVLLSFLRTQEPIRSEGAHVRKDGGRGWVPVCAWVAGWIFLLLPTLSLVATLQGFLQIFLLLAFGWAMYSDEKLRSHLPFWIGLSLLPVALFALGQGLMQFVPAIKWLGVALHDPFVRGVSVIEIGTQRFLRAYGSFPHPNILGGWMMIGVLISLREYLQREGRRYWWLIMSALFILTLYASFSRSAWIGCVVGLTVLGWETWKEGKEKLFFIALVGLLMTVGGAVAIKPELVITRVVSHQRLEVKSVNERTASIKQGLTVIRSYPFGTGFGAYRVGLDRVCAESPCVAPTEPPHFIPLLVLAEFGWMRVLGLIFIVGWIVRRHRSEKKIDFALVLPFLVLAGFDHYLWSLWAGQTLLLEAGFFIVLTARLESINL